VLHVHGRVLVVASPADKIDGTEAEFAAVPEAS
jgi:hypothetical protein